MRGTRPKRTTKGTLKPIAIAAASSAAHRFGRTFSLLLCRFSCARVPLVVLFGRVPLKLLYTTHPECCYTRCTLPTAFRQISQHQLPRYQLLSSLTSRHLFRAHSSPALTSTTTFRFLYQFCTIPISIALRPVHPDPVSFGHQHTPPSVRKRRE